MNGSKHRKIHGSDEGKVTLELIQSIGSLAVAVHDKPINAFKNFRTNSEQCCQDEYFGNEEGVGTTNSSAAPPRPRHQGSRTTKLRRSKNGNQLYSTSMLEEQTL